jgi:hypothetical protein
MHYFYTGVIVPASVILPIGAAVYAYRQLEKPHKILLFYLVIAGIIDVMASYMAHHKINNLWLLHIYTAIEAVLLLWYYKMALNDNTLRRVIPYLMVLFPIVCAVNIFWGQGVYRINTYTRPVEALMLIFMGIVYFLERSHEPVVARKGLAASMTWINAGLLFYMSASLFFFAFSNFLHTGQFFSIFIIICHSTFIVIMYLLFMIGFLKCRS